MLDLFPPVYRHPLRLELFGDELESVRLFDAASQRTLRTVERVHIHPVRETILTEGADPRARILAAADAASLPSSKTRHLLEQIEAGEDFFGIESLAPAFHQQMAPAFEYLPPGTLFVVEDPEAVLEETRRDFSTLRESAEHRRAEHRLALDPEAFFLDEETAAAALADARRIELRTLEIAGGADDWQRAVADPERAQHQLAGRAGRAPAGRRVRGDGHVWVSWGGR